MVTYRFLPCIKMKNFASSLYCTSTVTCVRHLAFPHFTAFPLKIHSRSAQHSILPSICRLIAPRAAPLVRLCAPAPVSSSLFHLPFLRTRASCTFLCIANYARLRHASRTSFTDGIPQLSTPRPRLPKYSCITFFVCKSHKFRVPPLNAPLSGSALELGPSAKRVPPVLGRR